ncbi:hypothetical protein [Actinacidiphila acidipaludis]|uniref:Chromosome partitioning protein n=1 Tax=Actinacidiphila acidipaludis TaxID=2873382 RepID=A0ABS7Q9N5_9ACTN|nr:hypothetical protein [Streptomyces acidipaludis]MBY8879556.1 hypothetical protein [Streptomyces acidipaludis]
MRTRESHESQGVAVFGAEVAVGYLCAYLVRKARRAGGALDTEVDRAVDAGLERVHGLVARALGDDAALALARRQAEGDDHADGEVSERTRRRLAGALEEAMESDPGLAGRLGEAVAALRAAESAAGGGADSVVTGNVFHGPAAFQSGGHHNTQTNHFGS